MEHYISQLKNSGYSRRQAREIIVCGVVGWRRKLERREKKGQAQFREAKDTLEERSRAKLLEKTSWYKGDKKRKADDEASKYKYTPPTKRRKKAMGNNIITKEASKKIKSVMKMRMRIRMKIMSLL